MVKGWWAQEDLAGGVEDHAAIGTQPVPADGFRTLNPVTGLGRLRKTQRAQGKETHYQNASD